MKKQLEICVFNLSDCITASKYNIDRIEFCKERNEGGLSPKKKEIKSALMYHENIFPIIRPRKGDFIYNNDEINEMINLIQYCKEVGCRGVVFGVLNNKNQIDIEKCKILKEKCRDMSTTFHKAFDEIKNIYEAVDDLIEIGFDRILTSGKREKVIDGVDEINKLANYCNSKISIMPGGSLRSNNIDKFTKNKDLNEFHSSCIIKNNLDENEIKNLIKKISNIRKF